MIRQAQARIQILIAEEDDHMRRYFIGRLVSARYTHSALRLRSSREHLLYPPLLPFLRSSQYLISCPPSYYHRHEVIFD